jgi:hypothetical protein
MTTRTTSTAPTHRQAAAAAASGALHARATGDAAGALHLTGAAAVLTMAAKGASVEQMRAASRAARVDDGLRFDVARPMDQGSVPPSQDQYR